MAIDPWSWIYLVDLWIEFQVLVATIFALGFLVLYTAHYWLTQVDKVKVLYQPTAFNCYVVEKCQTLQTKYYPPFWLWNPHMQGGLGLLLRKIVHLPYQSEYVKSEDGANLLLNWLPIKDALDTTPIVLIIPGITGGSDKPYVSHMAQEANKHNWHSVVLIFPGCLIKGTESNPCTTPRFYSPHYTADLKIVTEHIHNRYPKSPIIAIGHSYGAVMLVRYLGEAGANTHLEMCLSLSNPWDFEAVGNYIQKYPISRLVYDQHFLGYWKSIYRQNFEQFKKVKELNHDQIEKAQNLFEFEDRFTRVIYGYKSMAEYRKDSNCIDSIKTVKIPLLVLQAYDDPVVPSSALPLQELQSNPHCIVSITKAGGHSGWLEGHLNPRGLCFADKLCVETIDAFLEKRKEKFQSHGGRSN